MRTLETPALTVAPEMARPEDVARIAQLLEHGAPETIVLSLEEIEERLDRFLVLRTPSGTVVAAAALHPIDENSTELRSVAVDPDWRGHGLGRRIVRYALACVVGADRELFCYTFRPGFFRSVGFHDTASSSLPERGDRPSELDGRPRRTMSATADSMSPSTWDDE
ncbi:MAG: GNAT family N-acetyltransferase [Planctomycetota bacterium]